MAPILLDKRNYRGFQMNFKNLNNDICSIIKIEDLKHPKFPNSKRSDRVFTSQKLQDLKFEIEIKEKLKKNSIFKPIEVSELINKIIKWYELLNYVTLNVDPKEAKAKLKLYTDEIILSAYRNPNVIDGIKLVLELATAPFEARRWAFRILQKSNIEKNRAPLLIRIYNDWDLLKINMNNQIQNFVHTAFENMLSSDLSIINNNQIIKLTKKHTQDNTIITYIQPRFFALNSALTKIPHQNSRNFFDTLLRISSINKINILPMILPYTNLMPEDVQFKNYTKIGHHTYGLEHKTLHQKIAYFEEYSYLDEGGFGPFSKKLSYNKQLDMIRSINVEKAKIFCDALYQKYCQAKISKFPQSSKKISLDNDRIYYFFSMQTINDTVIRKGFIDQFTAIICILSQFQNTNKILLVKRHPLDNTQITQKFLNQIVSHPNCKVVDHNIHDLISASEATICINSGVGIEALIHLKPVFTLGESDYGIATTVLKSKSELCSQMQKKPEIKEPNFIRQFLYFFLNYHTYKNDEDERILLAIKNANK